MEQINNDDTIKECSRVLGHQVENKPQLDTSKIILVSDINPKGLRRCNIVRMNQASNATTATIYTTPTDKDFYLCSYSHNVIKDATSTSTFSNINVTVDGAVQQISRIVSITLTAQNIGYATSLAIPIKLDRGTTITVTNSTNVANVTSCASITGYTAENTLSS